MFIPRPLIFIATVVLVLAAVVLASAACNAWNGYQHGFSTTFHNMTDDTLCSGHPGCDPGGAIIKPHSTAHWAVGDSCGVFARGEVYTDAGELIYSRTVPCGDWDGRTLWISKRDDEFFVVDDFDHPYEP